MTRDIDRIKATLGIIRSYCVGAKTMGYSEMGVEELTLWKDIIEKLDLILLDIDDYKRDYVKEGE